LALVHPVLLWPWSLAETRMKILCLEQGDWVKSDEFPSNGRDREARRYSDFDISPNRRARNTDYPINDDNSIMKIANFNAWVTARSSIRRIIRACIRPTSGSRRWTEWRTTGQSATSRLRKKSVYWPQIRGMIPIA
jgi:hypothetical protein